MSFEQWLKFVHVIGAVLWLGGGVMVGMMSVDARRKGKELALIRQMEWVGPRIGGPAQLIMIVTGLWLVARSPGWSYGQAFVVTGIVVWVGLGLLGGAVHPRTFKAINATVEAEGPDSPRVAALARRSFAASWVEVALLVFVVWVMVGKYGL